MTVSELFYRLNQDPKAAIAAALAIGVMVVNGMTDAPVAITGCVSSGAIKQRTAVIMAAVCNLLGGVISVCISPRIAQSVMGSVRLEGELASGAVCAGLGAVIVWSLAAYRFGIPTSESHGLLAALGGSAIAVAGRSGIGLEEWKGVLWGLVLSSLLGFVLGFWSTRLARRLFLKKRTAEAAVRPALVLGGGAMSLMHGAQDAQKLMGVMMLCLGGSEDGSVPLWIAVATALAISLGSLIGGRRIIDNVGRRMVRPEKCRALSADLAGAMTLLTLGALGLPVSTTHTHTAAVMGAGASVGRGGVDLGRVRGMLLAWVLTFPCCGLLGYLGARLFMLIN